VAIITLALGIGATTAIFSVVDAGSLRPLPFPEADRLVYLREVNASGNTTGVAEPNLDDIETRSQSFAALGYVGGGNLVVTGGSEAVRTRVSYASRRIFEVLGAQAADVLRMALGHGMKLTLTSVALGLLAAFALTRLMKSLLFGVEATDPLTFTAVALLLTIMALLACMIPARRATKTDPITALRNE
jgi:predicted lysophospholipase L1 biosynthesis ABC-type transport system permease subunit